MVCEPWLGLVATKKTNSDLQTCYQVIINLFWNRRNKGDASNYSSYPDSTELPKPIKPADDPFINWWLNIIIENNTFILSTNWINYSMLVISFRN